MNIRSRPVLAIAAVMALALAGGGAAFAVTKSHTKNQSKSTTTQKQSCDRDAFRGRQGPGLGFSDAAATYLGLTTDQLWTRLRSGQSLADIAKAQGKSVGGLKGAIISGATTNLQKAVDAGTLTEAQKNDILSHIRSHIDDFVNGTLPR